MDDSNLFNGFDLNNDSFGSGFSDNSDELNFGESLQDTDSNPEVDLNTDDTSEIFKKSKKVIIIGVAVIIGVLLLAVGIKAISNLVTKKSSNIQKAEDISASMKSNRSEVKIENNVIQNINDDYTWLIIDNEQQVQFNDSYTDTTFVITNIINKARKVDESGTIEIKTTLEGTISGLSGTYKIDVPYKLGSQLKGVGQSFKVKVLLGTYNGSTVVGDILY